MRRAAWRKATQQAVEVPDLGPARLDSFVGVFATRIASVLGPGLEVSYDDVTRCVDPSLLPSERVWRCDLENAPVWCAIDATSHRALLEWILNGPGAPIPTAAERTIVSECVDRVLSSSIEGRWRESVGGIDLPRDVWLRVLDVSGAGRHAAIKLYTTAEAEPRYTQTPVLDDVFIELKAQLRPFVVPLSVPLSWQQGATVRLGDSADALHAQLRIVGGPFVFGTLGRTDGRRAVRLNGRTACRSAP